MRCSRPWASSSLPPRCREPSGLLPTRRWVTEDGPPPPVELGAVATRSERHRFADRATHVPQAAVTSGNQRTITVTRRWPLSGLHTPDLGSQGDAKLHGMQALMAGSAGRRRPGRPVGLVPVTPIPAPNSQPYRSRGIAGRMRSRPISCMRSRLLAGPAVWVEHQCCLTRGGRHVRTGDSGGRAG